MNIIAEIIRSLREKPRDPQLDKRLELERIDAWRRHDVAQAEERKLQIAAANKEAEEHRLEAAKSRTESLTQNLFCGDHATLLIRRIRIHSIASKLASAIDRQSFSLDRFRREELDQDLKLFRSQLDSYGISGDSHEDVLVEANRIIGRLDVLLSGLPLEIPNDAPAIRECASRFVGKEKVALGRWNDLSYEEYVLSAKRRAAIRGGKDTSILDTRLGALRAEIQKLTILFDALGVECPPFVVDRQSTLARMRELQEEENGLLKTVEDEESQQRILDAYRQRRLALFEEEPIDYGA